MEIKDKLDVYFTSLLFDLHSKLFDCCITNDVVGGSKVKSDIVLVQSLYDEFKRLI